MRGSGWCWLGIALGIGSALLARDASAQPGDGARPGLDRLLRLPESMEYATDERGGATRAEWRQRFASARSALAEAEKALETSQGKLAEVAGAKSDWQLTPPGVPAQSEGESSASFPLREQVRRQRGEVDRSKARLRELEVQANLAGVPEDWRSASTDARSGDDASDVSETGAKTLR